MIEGLRRSLDKALDRLERGEGSSISNIVDRENELPGKENEQDEHKNQLQDKLV